MKLFYHPDLPDVPREFMIQAQTRISNPDEKYKQNPHRDGAYHTNRRLILDDQRSTISVALPRYKVSDEFEAWCKLNISPHVCHAGLVISVNNDVSGTGVVHSDRTHVYNLLYVIDTGGDDVETCFYQEHGEPLLRDMGVYVEDFRRLKVIDTIRIPRGRWTVLDSRILHNVQGMERPRIFFSVGLDVNPWQEAMQS